MDCELEDSNLNKQASCGIHVWFPGAVVAKVLAEASKAGFHSISVLVRGTKLSSWGQFCGMALDILLG